MPSDRLALSLLLAAPTLVDTFFEQTVILLAEHNQDGAMGFIVNQPMTLTLGDIGHVMQLDVHPSYQQAFVYGGGPVTPEQGWIIAKRNETTPADLRISAELDDTHILLADLDSLQKLLEVPAQEFRLILGCAGWGPDQLSGELREGVWLTQEFDPSALLAEDSEALWQRLLERQGLGEGLLWGRPIFDA